MLKGQASRLLRPLAALSVLAATLVLPAVSHGSVVDQYTEDIPTPTGDVGVNRPAGSGTGAGNSEESANAEVGEDLIPQEGLQQFGAPEKDRGGRGPQASASQSPDTSGSTSNTSGVSETGMGPVFPAALIIGLLASLAVALSQRKTLDGTGP